MCIAIDASVPIPCVFHLADKKFRFREMIQRSGHSLFYFFLFEFFFIVSLMYYLEKVVPKWYCPPQ